MGVEDVLASDVVADLTDRLEERQRLDVADGAADLGDDDVDRRVTSEREDALLDLVRDVRDDLDGLTEELAAAFALQDGPVDLSRREVRRLACG